MADKLQKVKVNIDNFASGIYAYLMRNKLLTPDEFHALRTQSIKELEPEEETEDGGNK